MFRILICCFLFRKILNNDCCYKEVVLKKVFFYGNTMRFAQQTLR